MIYVQAIFSIVDGYLAKVILQTDVIRIQRKSLTMRYLFAWCFATFMVLASIEASTTLGAPPAYMLPSPPEATIQPQASPPTRSSGSLPSPNSSSSAGNLSWGGVNYPSSGNSFVMPTQAQIEQDFGILNTPQEVETGENAYSNYGISTPAPVDLEAFEWQVLPRDIMYRAYLASTKESRLAAQLTHETDHDLLWDGWAGGRFGLVRYGNRNPIYQRGVQVDIEAAGLVRLDVMNDVDVQSVDFRAGIPVSIGWGQHQSRFGYYHLSSHTGDEFMLKNPSHQRLNFARDVLFIGHAYYLSPEFRLYGELGWAFYTDVSKEWEVQFGFDYSPRLPTGRKGVPFFAVHGHLREELDFGGGVSAQAGWAWKGEQGSGILRTGLQYYNGMSPQYSFFNRHEQQIGIGVWYDY
ncbi:MAG: hypothetical protein RLY14_2644 [Planctomycetota bacterium]|jgi:hypothetical protein